MYVPHIKSIIIRTFLQPVSFWLMMLLAEIRCYFYNCNFLSGDMVSFKLTHSPHHKSKSNLKTKNMRWILRIWRCLRAERMETAAVLLPAFSFCQDVWCRFFVALRYQSEDEYPPQAELYISPGKHSLLYEQYTSVFLLTYCPYQYISIACMDLWVNTVYCIFLRIRRN